jgi:hypothetical protein
VRVFAQDHDHPDELHFSHPLVVESPSPDTKIRFDYFDYSFKDGIDAREHTPRVEFEYAFRPSFSIETDVPYTFRKVTGTTSGTEHLDSIEIALKFANFRLKERHLLFVYGVSFELPTGSSPKEIGSSHIFEVKPYFGTGVKRDKVEVVTFSSASFPTNKDPDDEETNELGYQLSVLFKPGLGIEPLIEVDGSTLLAGSESGQTVVNLSPGMKFRPITSEHWQFGVGIGFPLTTAHEFHRRVLASVFYHF